MDYTNEATTYIGFPAAVNVDAFCAAVGAKYDPSMVAIYRDGLDAVVDHASNLGTELRGLAYLYEGRTITRRVR